MADRVASSANIYIVDNGVAWDRLRELAATDFAPGSPEEAIYLNAQIAEAATVTLASPAERDARFQAMIDHARAVGDLGGLHAPFLSLMADAEQRGATPLLRAGRSAWDALAGKRAPRAIGGKIPVYDPASKALVLVDPGALEDALPPLPSGITDVAGIVNFLNGIDSRIHDAFGNPQGDPGFDEEVTNVVSSLNQTAVGIAAMAGVGMIVPGGQAIGAVLLVVSGVVAVGAAAASLIGSIVDFFTSTTPNNVAVPPNTPIPPDVPYVSDNSPSPLVDPGIPDTREADPASNDTPPEEPELPENPYPPVDPEPEPGPDPDPDPDPDPQPDPDTQPDPDPESDPEPDTEPDLTPDYPEPDEPDTEPDLTPAEPETPAAPEPVVNPDAGGFDPSDDDDDPWRVQTPDGT